MMMMVVVVVLVAVVLLFHIWSAHWVSIFIMNHCHRCLKRHQLPELPLSKGSGGGEMSALGEVHWCTGGGGERRDH